MLSSPRNPPAKTLRPSGSLRLTHQLKFSIKPLERSLQEAQIGAAQLLFNVVEEQCRPGVHRRIHVAEVPLVGRDLSVGMSVQIPQHQQELILGEIEVHQRKRNGVKRQVPCRVPGILPLVGHGDDVAVQHVEPLGIARTPLTRSHQRMSVMLLQPLVEIEIVVLLGPQHSGQRLAVYATFVFAQRLSE